MRLADFFKIVEDKHLPDDTVEFRDSRCYKLIGRIINIGDNMDTKPDVQEKK